MISGPTFGETHPDGPAQSPRSRHHVNDVGHPDGIHGCRFNNGSQPRCIELLECVRLGPNGPADRRLQAGLTHLHPELSPDNRSLRSRWRQRAS